MALRSFGCNLPGGLLGLALWALAATTASRSTAAVGLPPGSPGPLQFAVAEVGRAASAAKSPLPDVRLEIGGNGAPQSYRIERAGAAWRVIGADAAGAMYGGLDVAEAVRLGTLAQLADGERRPFIARRGLKFNIPLDVRTPSYSDNADAFQANLLEMWSREFWREFLDEMARHRFNVLTLWNLHPFPSIVKVPEYPDVALNDVLRARFDRFDDSFSHIGKDMFRPELLEGAEVVKRMSIDDKITFWREVLEMARDRGVEVYWFTWNTFLCGVEGRHGLTRGQPDDNLVRYFRASVRETVKTYPLLAGIGITAGEYMDKTLGGLTKEQWLWQTYGEGVRDALKDEPGRPFRLIHRFHQTDLAEVLREWKDYPGPFDFSYKYAVAHMYAATRPPFIDPLLEVLPKTHRTWLTVRNDDIYSFRWGDPAFAREFIRRMPGPEQCAGFYMGPDGYCWGREAMDLEPESPRQLVMQKQWFSFMLWGRLACDPNLPDALFERALAVRFPQAPAAQLLGAWSAASRVFPEITRFFWGNIDLRWLPEACLSHPRHRGFYTVRHFIEGETMPGSGNLDIREWRERRLKDQPMNGTTPLQVAANLRRHADEALAGVAIVRAANEGRNPSRGPSPLTPSLSPGGGEGAGRADEGERRLKSGGQVQSEQPTAPESAAGRARLAERAADGSVPLPARSERRALPAAAAKELRLTLGDIEAFSHIGRYYAAKIEGACELALFDATGRSEHQQDAVKHLQEALNHWRAYATVYAGQYRQPLLYNRVGWVDIPKLADKVAADIRLARDWQPGTAKPRPVPKGKSNIFGQ